MARYAAFVRAVMIGREGLHRAVLLDIARRAGGTDPVSYISTGNLTVDVPAAQLDAWTARTETGIESVVGRRTEVFVRSIDELRRLQQTDPFAGEPFPDVQDRTVSFLYETPDAGTASPVALPLWSTRGDIVVFAATPRELFAVNRLVGGRTSGAGGLIERTLGRRVTTRSWSTVERVLRTPTG